MYNYQLFTNLLILISIFCFIIALICKLILTWLKVRSDHLLLEITPPHNAKQSPLATEQFLATLHALLQQRSIAEKLFGKNKHIALEIVSNKESGIRFLIRVAPADADVIKKHLLSFLPGARITIVDDYLPIKVKTHVQQYWRTVTLKLTKGFAHSLQEQTHLDQHDPMSYITGQMTKLNYGEFIAVQYIITPRTKRNIPPGILLLNVVAFILLTPITFLSWLMSHDNKTEASPLWLFAPKKQDKKETDEKIQKELFAATIRLYVSQQSEKDITSRMQGLFTSFASFRSTNQQELRVKKSFPMLIKFSWLRRLFFLQLKYRLLALSDNPVLSATEIAGLFHFPTVLNQTEDIVKSKSTLLPAPLSLKKTNKPFDIFFAHNTFAETVTQIGLTKDERRRHVYVLGATGMGKTTLLATMIREDIKNGKGVCVIDPHGNLIEQILPLIPKDRAKDVILFDPDDTEFPIGLNLLALPKDLTANELQRQKEHVTSNLISVITKMYAARFTGPRMEYILRNTILTALETEQPTLFTIQQLLVDVVYRKKVVATLKNQMLKLFWTKEFAQMGSFQKADAVAPITNKIGKFLTSSLAANILGQKETKLDFSDIMDSGKILLCDLTKGNIGEDMSTMFGSLIVAGVQLAALKRARIPENQRKDFYLYIDEFQNFATSSFAQIMSEARKYRLNAILAHQTIAQIEDHDLVKVILANTGSIISFRTGGPLDEEFILSFFAPSIAKNEITNLPPYHFYMKINNDTPQDCFSGETIYQEIPQNKVFIDKMRNYSRKQYASEKRHVEQEIQKTFFTQTMPTKQKKETKRGPKRVLPEETLLF
ncbi:MAG: ATP-binding protein [Candidatus Levybacteria bacterium]|nr:ATP-binding protein [Candidatus Levybacteria bacterium]